MMLSGAQSKKKVMISDAHSTWSPTGWDLGASRGSIIYLNVSVLFLMVSGHTSSSQGALEEVANVDSGGHRWSGKRNQEIGRGFHTFGDSQNVWQFFTWSDGLFSMNS